MIIDPIGGKENTRQPSGFGRARIAKRVIIVGHECMFGNIANARDCHVIGEKGQ